MSNDAYAKGFRHGPDSEQPETTEPVTRESVKQFIESYGTVALLKIVASVLNELAADKSYMDEVLQKVSRINAFYRGREFLKNKIVEPLPDAVIKRKLNTAAKEARPRREESMSFKAEINVHDDPKYYQNAVALATREEAESFARNKVLTWTLAESYRVVGSDEPVNYQWSSTAGVVLIF